MAIITHLTEDDVAWYQKQVTWCREILASEVARCGVSDPSLYEPKKPTEYCYCKPEFRAQFYIRDIEVMLSKLRQDYPDMGVQCKAGFESDPPSVWMYVRPSRWAWDCPDPWVLWTPRIDEQRIAFGQKPIVPPRPGKGI